MLAYRAFLTWSARVRFVCNGCFSCGDSSVTGLSRTVFVSTDFSHVVGRQRPSFLCAVFRS